VRNAPISEVTWTGMPDKITPRLKSFLKLRNATEQEVR